MIEWDPKQKSPIRYLRFCHIRWLSIYRLSVVIMDGMDDIDEFLNSIEDLTASHSAEESGGAIDPELEALFDDFNSMIDTKKKESTENEESVLKVGVVEKNTYDLSVENVDELEDDDVVGVLKHHEHIVDRSNSLSDTEKTSSSSIGASLPTTENTTTSTRDKARRKVVPPPVVREKRNKDKPSYIFGKEEESEPVRDTISSQSSYPSQSDTEIITNNSVDVDADVDAEPQHDETNKKGETISLALAPDADEFMTWLDHVNVKLEGGDEGKQRDTGTGKHGLALASSLTSVADHIPSPKTTLPMPPSGIASGGSSTSSSGSSGKYAASVNMDAFFSEVFGPTHITTQTQAIHQTHAIEGVEECAVVAAGRNISQQRQASPVSVISCARLPSMDITSDHVNTRDTPAMLLPHPLSLIQNDLFISYMRHVNESGNGNDKGMTVHRARELLYQHRYIPTQHRVGIYLYLLSEGKMSAATAVSAMDVKSATAMLSRSSISRIAIDSAAAVSNVKARCFNIAASASSGNGSVRSRCNNDEDKRLQKTLYDLLVLFCANKSVPYHPLYMYLISPVVCCEPALLASYSSLSSQEQEIVYTNVFSTLHNLLPLLISHSPIIDLPSQPHCMHRPQLCIGIATRATSQCLRQLLAYHNPVLADHMEKTVPGWEQPMMWDTGANNGNGKSLVLGVAEMQEKLYGSGIDDKKSVIESNIDGCESDVNIKGSSRLSSDGSASGLISDIDRIFGALSSADANLQNDQLPLSFDPSTASSKGKQAETSGKPFVSGHISIHFMCNIFTASVPYAQSLCLQDWIITSGERFAGVYLTAALLDIFSIFLLNMTGTEAREWLLQIAEGEGQWFKSSLLPSHHFFPNDSKPITEYSLQQGLDWRSFVSGWIHAVSTF